MEVEVAYARGVIYKYEAGAWKQAKGEKICRVSIWGHEKSSTEARIVAQVEGSGEVLINAYLSTSTSFSESSQPLFYVLEDPTCDLYNGMYLMDAADAKAFSKRLLAAATGGSGTSGSSANKKPSSSSSSSSTTPKKKETPQKSTGPTSPSNTIISKVPFSAPSSGNNTPTKTSTTSSLATASPSKSSPAKAKTPAPAPAPPTGFNWGPKATNSSSSASSTPSAMSTPPKTTATATTSFSSAHPSPSSDKTTSAVFKSKSSSASDAASSPSSKAFASNKSNPTKIGSASSPSSPSSSSRSLSLSSPSNGAKSSPAIASPGAAVSANNSSDKNQRQRQLVIDEVLKTERDYVDSLTLLREMYYLPLKYSNRLGVSIFAPGDLEKCFYGLETIFFLNQKLLQEMDKRQAIGTLYSTCGEMFATYAPSMKLYIDYVNKYDSTIEIVKRYRVENPIFDSFLKAGQEDNDAKGRGFHDFTVMPIQRIPRYVLLLQQVIKYTETSHPDYANIERALRTVEEIASYINTKKKEYDLNERVSMVQSCFVPRTIPIMKEGRTYLREGLLYMKAPEFEAPTKPIKKKKDKEPAPEKLGLVQASVYLFNDLIIWGIKDTKTDKLNEVARFPLYDIADVEATAPYSAPWYPESAQFYKGLMFRSFDMRDDAVPRFYTLQEPECAKWIADIKNASLKAAAQKASELDRMSKKINTVL